MNKHRLSRFFLVVYNIIITLPLPLADRTRTPESPSWPHTQHKEPWPWTRRSKSPCNAARVWVATQMPASVSLICEVRTSKVRICLKSPACNQKTIASSYILDIWIYRTNLQSIYGFNPSRRKNPVARWFPDLQKKFELRQSHLKDIQPSHS